MLAYELAGKILRLPMNLEHPIRIEINGKWFDVEDVGVDIEKRCFILLTAPVAE